LLAVDLDGGAGFAASGDGDAASLPNSCVYLITADSNFSEPNCCFPIGFLYENQENK